MQKENKAKNKQTKKETKKLENYMLIRKSDTFQTTTIDLLTNPELLVKIVASNLSM